MRILILANFDIGLYKFRKELIGALLAKQHEVFISLPDGDMVRPLEQMGCTFIPTPIDRRGINPKTDLRLLRRYRAMLRELRPDLVITYTIKPNIYGGIAARLSGIPYAANITGLGTAFETHGPLRTLVTRLYSFALKKARVIFFENTENRDTFLSFGICKREKTHVLHGAGVNLTDYNVSVFSPHDTVRFLFIGRVMREKGIDELFTAMRRLVQQDKLPCVLDVVGPFEDDYQQQLQKCESEGWLRYHGYQADVRPFIQACDCFVLPSYHEGMANTNLECAASGRPVITSDIAGCREAVLNGESGLLCEIRNADSLYEAMYRMVKMTPSDRAKMGLRGREHMQNVFDKEKVVQETIQELFR
ncbi:MAG: glycosyltransferase family 4 protein [Clostridia bacterium]|nr:glycosyltransferase family 4 protein [Clostridia bacterium]